MEEVSIDLELHEETTRKMFNQFVDIIAEVMEVENEEFRFGGDAVECEADEIALRCSAGRRGRERGVWWLRLFGLRERGDCGKIYLA